MSIEFSTPRTVVSSADLKCWHYLCLIIDHLYEWVNVKEYGKGQALRDGNSWLDLTLNGPAQKLMIHIIKDLTWNLLYTVQQMIQKYKDDLEIQGRPNPKFLKCDGVIWLCPLSPFILHIYAVTFSLKAF